MLRSKVKVVDKAPVYESASITTRSYMKRRKKFMRRAMACGSYDSVGGDFSCHCERCEAQQRWALHHHIPFWTRRCGPECKSHSRFCLRSPDNKMPPEIHTSERDNVHKMLHVGYVQAQLARPYPVGTPCLSRSVVEHSDAVVKKMTSCMDLDDILVCYFIRRTQINWVIHRCTLNYCKANGSCRFFFPYDKPQHKQCQNDDINRIAHIRRHIPDDAYVAAHNLELLILGGTHVQVQLFCPVKGGRSAGLYCVLYKAAF